MSYFNKLKGQGDALPPTALLKQIGFVWLGGFLAVAVIGSLAYFTSQPLILGSYGATIFVLFILPDTPFLQPRNVIGGHLISILSGLLFFHLISPKWWTNRYRFASGMTYTRVNRCHLK